MPRPNFKKYNKSLLYLIAIALGIGSGVGDFVPLQDLATFISELFIKAFKCISLPIIALSLIVTLSQYNSEEQMKNIWQRTLLYTIGTTFVAAAVACTMYLLVAPENISSPNLTEASDEIDHHGSYLSYFSNMIPDNIFSPFLQHQVLAALFVSIAIGIAIRKIPDRDARSSVGNFFKGAHGIFMVITGWMVKIIPLALFGFITTTIIHLKNGADIKGLGQYLTIIVLANLVQGLLILPAFLRYHNINPAAALKGMMPALSVAFFSKSSAGTLPITIETIEKNLQVNPKVSRFVLPLCTSINMNGCAAFIFTTVIYLMQNHGVVIDPITMLLWIFIATVAALGNAGVPMGCFFLSTSLLASMNVPITLLGLILPFYSVIDMVETAVNVWSDSCITKVVDEKNKTSIG